MCDYSLHAVKSRAAQVGDKLITHNFGTGTRGFAAVDDSKVAVCVRPGTEIGFDETIKRSRWSFFLPQRFSYSKVAIFRQVDKDNKARHHDALEFPDGKIVLLTTLDEGQRATVLQLPAIPKTEAEAIEQKRAEYV